MNRKRTEKGPFADSQAVLFFYTLLSGRKRRRRAVSYQNPFINPYGMAPQYPPVMPAAAQQVVRVNGENGARAYQIGPNGSALLLDESGLMVWLITSDGAGYKTVQAYDIAPHREAPAPDYGSLEDRIRRREERINGDTGNTSAAGEKQYAAAGAARPANDERGTRRAEPSGNAKQAYYEQPADEAGYGHRAEARR